MAILITQCCICGKILGTKKCDMNDTREYKAKFSHTYCDACVVDMDKIVSIAVHNVDNPGPGYMLNQILYKDRKPIRVFNYKPLRDSDFCIPMILSKYGIVISTSPLPNNVPEVLGYTKQHIM